MTKRADGDLVSETRALKCLTDGGAGPTVDESGSPERVALGVLLVLASLLMAAALALLVPSRFSP